MYIGRFTAQPAAKHRVSVNFEYQHRCEGSPLLTESSGCQGRGSDWVAAGAMFNSPEAHLGYRDFPYHVLQGRWTSPLSNRLLLEAGATYYKYRHEGGFGSIPPDGILDIGVTQISTAINPVTGAPYAPRGFYNYRAVSQYAEHTASPNNWNASAQYVTGSHSMKVGYQGGYQAASQVRRANPSLLSYTFNQANPTSFNVRLPDWGTADRTWTSAFFVQDTWTRGQMTLQAALRYDRAWSYSPAGLSGTTTAAPQLGFDAITFPRTPSVDSYNDITPRFGVAYDLFGNGKTALKFSGGRYLEAASNGGAFTQNNPANRIVDNVTRGWTDSNGNRVVDCDLSVLTAQNHTATGGDICAGLTGNSLNFGNVSTGLTEVNQDTLRGWGVRGYDWQWNLGVQQEVIPRVSAEVAYARRSYYMFTVTDNRNRNPEGHWEAWTINAPIDPRLPNGGGYPITLYAPTAAAAAMPASNYITWETDYGPARSRYWQGVDVTVNARTRHGLTLQIGTNTGRLFENTCASVVNINSPDTRNCLSSPPYQTAVRGLASYTIPLVDVLVSGAIRSQPPLGRTANWPVPNTTASAACGGDPSCLTVESLLGRIPPGGTATGTTTVALFDNDHRLYADTRRTQLDMRFAKIVRLGSTRTDIGVDLENMLNTNYATAFDNTYQFSVDNATMGGTWNNPTAIYVPRFVRLNFTVRF
jgi:hypothetical protein